VSQAYQPTPGTPLIVVKEVILFQKGLGVLLIAQRPATRPVRAHGCKLFERKILNTKRTAG